MQPKKTIKNHKISKIDWWATSAQYVDEGNVQRTWPPSAMAQIRQRHIHHPIHGKILNYNNLIIH